MIVTESPLCLRSKPREAEAIPFPSDDNTPPEMKMYFVFLAAMIRSKNEVRECPKIEKETRVHCCIASPQRLFAKNHICCMTASPNAEHDTSVAPSIKRAKS